MKRICLVYPNGMELPGYFRYATNISTDTIETLPPMGLLYVIGNSKRQIDFIDNRIKKYGFEQLCQILMQYDVVGFGGTIFEIKEARRLSAHLIKNGKPTFYGGPNATVNWRFYLGRFSIIWRGEAELMFDKALDNIDNLEQIGFTRIAGSYVNLDTFRVKELDSLRFPDRTKIRLDDYRRQEFHYLGGIQPIDIIVTIREYPFYFYFFRSLDSLRFPDRTKIRLDDYRRQEFHYLGGIQPIDIIVTSRGCPFDCYFCSSRVIWDRKYTYRSARNVMEEIGFMKETHGTKGLYFREDNFTTNRKRLLEFCERVKDFSLVWL